MPGAGLRNALANEVKLASVQQFPPDFFTSLHSYGFGQGGRHVHIEPRPLILGTARLYFEGVSVLHGGKLEYNLTDIKGTRVEHEMSLPDAKIQGSLFDVPVLTAGLFDRRNRYRLFREKILPALYGMREELCALYCEDNGRPGIEPVILAGTSLLQFMEKAPDRQAAELVKLHGASGICVGNLVGLGRLDA